MLPFSYIITNIIMKRTEILKRCSSLGYGMLDKAKIAVSYLYLRLKDSFFLPPISLSICFSFHGRKQRLSISSISDYWAIKDIFLDGEYDLKREIHPTIIVDLGANIGISAIYFALKYPHAQVFAFEPHPQTFARLKENVKDVASIHPHKYAISDAKGHVSFSAAKHSTHASLFGSSKDFVDVESIRPDDLFGLLNIEKIDILKFDIEGAERFLLEDFSRFGHVRNYVGEMHYDIHPVRYESSQEKIQYIQIRRAFYRAREAIDPYA